MNFKDELLSQTWALEKYSSVSLQGRRTSLWGYFKEYHPPVSHCIDGYYWNWSRADYWLMAIVMSLLPLLFFYLLFSVFFNGRQAGRQAAPTCYMDRSKDHRISLDRSNSFLHPSCPYWFGPFLPRCAPVALIKHKSFIPHRTKHEEKERKREREEGERKREETKERRQQLQTLTMTKERKTKREKKKRKNWTPPHMQRTFWAHCQYLLVTWTYEKPTAFP